MDVNAIEDRIKENKLEEQITVFEKDGKLLIKTSEGFNATSEIKQNQIVSTVVDILLKSNKTDHLLTVGITEKAEITLNILDNFSILSLPSQEQILFKLSSMMRKMSEIKGVEAVTNSEWIN